MSDNAYKMGNEEVENKTMKAYSGCGCSTCKEMDLSCENCPVCTSKSYMSDDEDLDKWNNINKACWEGYEQQGMKDKGGRKVPNCVYVGKSESGKAKKIWKNSSFEIQ